MKQDIKAKAKELNAIHHFLHQAEALKQLLRHSWLSGGRQESVAEHTWRMCLMAIVLKDQLETEVDLGKTLQMIVIHDLAEIKAGDYHAFGKVPKNKHELEEAALNKIIAELDASIQESIISLWNEFEARKTPEAKFAQALDKLEVLIQHNEAGASTWKEEEYDFNCYYGYDKVDHSQTLTTFRDLILEETLAEINKEIPS